MGGFNISKETAESLPKWFTPSCISKPSSVNILGQCMIPALLMRISTWGSAGNESKVNNNNAVNTEIISKCVICCSPPPLPLTTREVNTINLCKFSQHRTKRRNERWALTSAYDCLFCIHVFPSGTSCSENVFGGDLRPWSLFGYSFSQKVPQWECLWSRPSTFEIFPSGRFFESESTFGGDERL